MENLINSKSARFILFFNARSGSNLLQSLLNSHPHVYCEGEIFHEKIYTNPALSPEKHLEEISSKHHKPVFGFKLSAYHLKKIQATPGNEQFFDRLVQNGWKVIYCSRQNVVKQALSLLLVQKTNISHLRIGETAIVPKVTIRITEWLRTIYGIEYFRRIEQRKMASISHLQMNYEKDLFPSVMHQSSANKVFRHLNIDSVPVHTLFIPTSPSSLLPLMLYRTMRRKLAVVNFLAPYLSYITVLFE